MTQRNGVNFKDNLAHDSPKQPAKRLFSALAVRNVEVASSSPLLAPREGFPTWPSPSCSGD